MILEMEQRHNIQKRRTTSLNGITSNPDLMPNLKIGSTNDTTVEN